MKKSLSWLVMALLSTQASAFDCYITMVKDSCWTDYNLTVDVHDATNDKQLAEIVVPKGQSWGREAFACDKGQTLSLFAKFDPIFWSADEGKTFPGQRYWKLPDNIESGISGWNVTVCYPKWFANVPTPPNATANCKCDTDNIPTLSPVKIVN